MPGREAARIAGMMWKTLLLLCMALAGRLAFAEAAAHPANPPQQEGAAYSAALTKEQLLKKYKNVRPRQWSWRLPGIVEHFETDENAVALTLDLCGSGKDGLDERIVSFLEAGGIKATFFVTSRWIERHPKKFARLAANPLFEIEAHGQRHRPASLNARRIYGMRGTANASELYDEVMQNAEKITAATGLRPRFFRSGAAYYDEFAVAQIYDMGLTPLGFSVLGDAGAAMNANRVKAAFAAAKGGDIIIAHANHPEKSSGKGVVMGIALLLEKGFTFVRLDEVLK